MKKYLLIFLLAFSCHAQSNVIFSVSNWCYHLGFTIPSHIYTNPIVVTNMSNGDSLTLSGGNISNSIPIVIIPPYPNLTNILEIRDQAVGLVFWIGPTGSLNSIRPVNLSQLNAGQTLVTNLFIPTNSFPWPASPVGGKSAFIGDSNGFVYLLQSSTGNTWTKTNLIGSP